MLSLYFSTLLEFLVGVVVQIAVWRTLGREGRTVPYQILWLFGIFLGGPVLHFLFHHSADQLILALSLGCAYVMSFPAASAQSPTILILDLLDRHQGLTESELQSRMAATTNLIGDRLQDLAADGLASAKNGEMRPSTTGRALGYTFWLYRRALGLPLGEG